MSDLKAQLATSGGDGTRTARQFGAVDAGDVNGAAVDPLVPTAIRRLP